MAICFFCAARSSSEPSTTLNLSTRSPNFSLVLLTESMARLISCWKLAIACMASGETSPEISAPGSTLVCAEAAACGQRPGRAKPPGCRPAERREDDRHPLMAGGDLGNRLNRPLGRKRLGRGRGGRRPAAEAGSRERNPRELDHGVVVISERVSRGTSSLKILRPSSISAVTRTALVLQLHVGHLADADSVLADRRFPATPGASGKSM